MSTIDKVKNALHLNKDHNTTSTGSTTGTHSGTHAGNNAGNFTGATGGISNSTNAGPHDVSSFSLPRSSSIFFFLNFAGPDALLLPFKKPVYLNKILTVYVVKHREQARSPR
jgi:hypothetical protein